MSLLILHQLEDKQMALEVYISFLKEVGLWQRVRPFSTLQWGLEYQTSVRFSYGIPFLITAVLSEPLEI